jgi:hypothetical protein
METAEVREERRRAEAERRVVRCMAGGRGRVSGDGNNRAAILLRRAWRFEDGSVDDRDGARDVRRSRDLVRGR